MNRRIAKYLQITIPALIMFGAGYIYGFNKSELSVFKDEMFDALHYAYILKSIDNSDYSRARESITTVINTSVVKAQQNKANLNETEYNAACALIKYVIGLDVTFEKDVRDKLETWRTCKPHT